MMLKNESIYIAGPECFYFNGTERLRAMRAAAESCGLSVTLPNDNELDLNHTDLRLNADAIFANCAESMNRSTGIICDLEYFRGPEPDSGSIYEIGMAYALGIRCYGYTRDKREQKWKYQGFELIDGVPYDRKGRILPNYNLPFAPNIIGSTKIIEGDFYDCLSVYLTDLEEERKHGWKKPFATPETQKILKVNEPVIYLALPERYSADGKDFCDRLSAYCREKGLHPLTPFTKMSAPTPESEDPLAAAYQTFLNNQQNVRNCDVILGNLNDFHGWEPESDTSFECGMGFQLGKKLYGYMSDTTIMRERVPNRGPNYEWRDLCECNTENFNYPLNLMFSSSMPILEGDAYAAIDRIADDLFTR